MFENKKIFIFGMARSGYEIAKLLLERGAKVNEKNIMKITPLVLSHKLKHPQMEGLIYKYLIMTLHNNK